MIWHKCLAYLDDASLERNTPYLESRIFSLIVDMLNLTTRFHGALHRLENEGPFKKALKNRIYLEKFLKTVQMSRKVHTLDFF